MTNAQEEYDQVESKARASKSAKEVGKTIQLRTELSTSYDHTAASAEAILKRNTWLNFSRHSIAFGTASVVSSLVARKIKRPNQQNQPKQQDKDNPLEADF